MIAFLAGHVHDEAETPGVIALAFVSAAAFGRWPTVASVAGGLAAGLLVIDGALDQLDRLPKEDP